MISTKTSGKSKKRLQTAVSSRTSKKETVSEINVEKNISNNPETNVSVFTKTTSPKVVIQSENVNTNMNLNCKNFCRRKLLKSVCMIVIGIIILITFFLSLRTYSIVSELSQLLLN